MFASNLDQAKQRVRRTERRRGTHCDVTSNARPRFSAPSLQLPGSVNVYAKGRFVTDQYQKSINAFVLSVKGQTHTHGKHTLSVAHVGGVLPASARLLHAAGTDLLLTAMILEPSSFSMSAEVGRAHLLRRVCPAIETERSQVRQTQGGRCDAARANASRRAVGDARHVGQPYRCLAVAGGAVVTAR
jgi:hypothetical protein